jgi:hypothetical protein
MENGKNTKKGGKVNKFVNTKLKIPFAVRKIDGPKRQIAIYAFVALLVFSAAGLLWSYTVSASQEEDYTTYYYLQEASFDYRIYAAPNNIFPSRVLGPGNAYITSLTDYIAVDFEYNYFGESEAELKGSYGVAAKLAAYTAQQEYLVWEKEYALLPTKQFNTIDSDFSFKERFNIPLAEYIAFTEQIREETGFNPAELNLVVTGNVSMEVATEDGAVSDQLSPTMIIPMKDSVFTVNGQMFEEKEGGIAQTRVVVAAPVSAGRAVFPVLVAITAIGLALLRFLTVPTQIKARSDQHQVPGILKKHKERIVVTANGVTALPAGTINVLDFDELLKLADEVGRPILYPQPSSVEGNNHFFLVYTPEQTYAYGIINSDTEAEVK